jgi:hypothetical protein
VALKLMKAEDVNGRMVGGVEAEARGRADSLNYS